MNVRTRWLKITVISLVSVICIGVLVYQQPDILVTSQQQTDDGIYTYDESRDMADILALFEKERYWLTNTPDYSPEHMLKYRAPNKTNILYKGSLHIAVLRQAGKLIGFTAYYKLTPQRGQLLFLAIDPEFRGKRYGERLINFVFNEFKKLGVFQVYITTRINNIPAQTLYRRVGFVETGQQNGFVDFDISL